MESSSLPMKVQCSKTTADLLLASCFPAKVISRGPIDIKGKGLMETYWIEKLDDKELALADDCLI